MALTKTSLIKKLDFLPVINAKYELTENSNLRFNGSTNHH
jgi:hypothetical protein